MRHSIQIFETRFAAINNKMDQTWPRIVTLENKVDYLIAELKTVQEDYKEQFIAMN